MVFCVALRLKGLTVFAHQNKILLNIPQTWNKQRIRKANFFLFWRKFSVYVPISLFDWGGALSQDPTKISHLYVSN
jgi:hypothetical protein